MNLLVINLDKNIFSPNSKSLERLKQYASIVDKIFVIVWTTKRERPLIFDDKLFIFPTNSRSRLFYYRDCQKIANYILRLHSIDLIFTQDPFETGLVGWLIARANNLPLQLQVHTDFLSPYFWRESIWNKLRVLLAKFLIPRAQTLRVVSERIKKSIVAAINFPLDRIFVLPIFVDTEKIKNSPITVDLHKKYSQFSFIILIASRLTKEKNIDLSIRSFAPVVRKYPKIGLVIVGQGPEEIRLKKMVKSKKMDDHVKFEQWQDDVYSYFRTADLFLLTSNYEGYGMSVAEAVAAGCPVIMTDVGCAGELIKDKINGLVVPINDARHLTQTLLSCLGDVVMLDCFSNFYATKDILGTFHDYLQKYKKTWESTMI